MGRRRRNVTSRPVLTTDLGASGASAVRAVAEEPRGGGGTVWRATAVRATRRRWWSATRTAVRPSLSGHPGASVLRAVVEAADRESATARPGESPSVTASATARYRSSRAAAPPSVRSGVPGPAGAVSFAFVGELIGTKFAQNSNLSQPTRKISKQD